MDAWTLTFEELLTAGYAPSAALFVRPHDDSKRFTGQARFASLDAVNSTRRWAARAAMSW